MKRTLGLLIKVKGWTSCVHCLSIAPILPPKMFPQPRVSHVNLHLCAELLASRPSVELGSTGLYLRRPLLCVCVCPCVASSPAYHLLSYLYIETIQKKSRASDQEEQRAAKERPWFRSKAGRPFPLSIVPFQGLARKSHYNYSFSWDEDHCPEIRLPLWGYYTCYTCILGWNSLATPFSVFLRLEQRLEGNRFCTRIIQAAYTYTSAPPPLRKLHPLALAWPGRCSWAPCLGALCFRLRLECHCRRGRRVINNSSGCDLRYIGGAWSGRRPFCPVKACLSI